MPSKPASHRRGRGQCRGGGRPRVYNHAPPESIISSNSNALLTSLQDLSPQTAGTVVVSNSPSATNSRLVEQCHQTPSRDSLTASQVPQHTECAHLHQ